MSEVELCVTEPMVQGQDEALYDRRPLIPVAWLERAAQLPGRSLHVGLALWYEAGRSGSTCVDLSNKLCARFSVERTSKYRALRCLEAADLIRPQRRRGRSPRVTILDGQGRP